MVDQMIMNRYDVLCVAEYVHASLTPSESLLNLKINLSFTL